MGEVSAFPLPPNFFHNYTTEAVESNTAPPPPPAFETFSVFGAVVEENAPLIQSLESQQLPRLYAEGDIDHIHELKALNRKLIGQFLDLINTLSDEPKETRDEQLAQIELIFINMHHLLNEFRPHQARETMRAMLELQLKQKKELGREIKRTMENTARVLRDLNVAKPTEKSQEPNQDQNKKIQANTGETSSSVSTQPMSVLQPMACGNEGWELSNDRIEEMLLDDFL
eukprot:m.61890 g.61890  ORF g.61890 m.61890 type:complete len:228 (-) comp19312_c0_seq2:388-1071(-)